ncbi:hypothetical protein LguiB_027470 [Lonicera macranthoides]
MLEYGYTPNTYTLNIVMDVLFKIGRVGISLRVLKEIQLAEALQLLALMIDNLGYPRICNCLEYTD